MSSQGTVLLFLLFLTLSLLLLCTDAKSSAIVGGSNGPDTIGFITQGTSLPDDTRFVISGKDNQLYMTATFSSSITLGSYHLTSNGDTDIVLAKMNSTSGQVIWAKTFGSANNDLASDVACSSINKYCYLTGSFNGTLVFSPSMAITSESPSSNDAFIIKVDSTNGNVIWVLRATQLYSPMLFLDPKSDALTLLGKAKPSLSFFNVDGTKIADLTISNDLEGCLTRIVTSGAGGVSWVRSIISDANTLNYFSFSGHNGTTLYITGSFNGEIVIDGTQNLVSKGYDAFLLKHDASTGVLHWAVTGGGSSNDESAVISIDSNGYPYITGYAVYNNISFGNCQLPGVSGSVTMFTVKYNPENGNCIWLSSPKSVGDSVFPYGAAVAKDSLYVTGQFSISLDLGGSLQLTAESALFIAKMNLENGTFSWALSAGASSDNYGSQLNVGYDNTLYAVGYIGANATVGEYTLPKTTTYLFSALVSPYCNGTKANDPSVCSGNGVCKATNTCVCHNNTEFSSDKYCAKIEVTETSVSGSDRVALPSLVLSSFILFLLPLFL